MFQPHLDPTPQNSSSSHSLFNLEVKDMKFNGWRAPNFRTNLLIQDLRRRANLSKGCLLEPSLLYVDTASADDWISLCSREDYDKYVSKHDLGMMDWAATIIRHYLESSRFDRKRIDVVGLGPGDGKNEEMLVRCLSEGGDFNKINCHLLDISPSILTEAHSYLSYAFANLEHIETSWLLGNFMELANYSNLFDEPESENVLRVVAMLGGTFGNIPNELHFVRHSLAALKSGDLFLVQVFLGFGPHDRPDIIQAEEPQLVQVGSSLWGKAVEAWLRGPIERFRRGMKSLRLENVLNKNSTSPIPNSYTVTIDTVIDESIRFTMLELRRYELNSFLRTFEQEGFIPISGERYGYQNNRLVYLFAKE